MQVGSAEKVAVTLHAAPFAGLPGNVYEIGLVHGRGTVALAPHVFVTVRVPEVGG